MNKLGSAGKPGSGSLVTADPIEESEALEAALHHGEREQLTMLTELQNRVHGNGSSGNGSSGNGEAH